jgi:hypothetical protein
MELKMLSRQQVSEIAENYLVKNDFPIVIGTARITFPEDECLEMSKVFLLKNNLAVVSFTSKYFNDPEHDLDPGIYMVYVNFITGEVDMPRSM